MNSVIMNKLLEIETAQQVKILYADRNEKKILS